MNGAEEQSVPKIGMKGGLPTIRVLSVFEFFPLKGIDKI